MPEIRFGFQDVPHSSKPVSAQRMINCYLVESTPGSRAQAFVTSSYGIKEFSALGITKAAKVINGLLYVVTPDSLKYVQPNGNGVTLGSIASVGKTAYIEGNANYIVIVTGGNGYVYTGGSLDLIADTDFPAAKWVGFLDGYWPVIEKNTGKVYINEAANNPTSWNPLDFASAEGSPDDLVFGLTNRSELLLFGKDSTEAFYNSHNSDYPFERSPNGFIERGIMSEGAAAKLDNIVYFMGNDGVAYRLIGFEPNRISNTFIDRQIEKHTKECTCLTWKEAGHPMIGFNFKEACHVFDASTNLWHSRRSYGYDNLNVRWSAFAYNMHLVGGVNIGSIDQDTFTEFGDTLRSQCTSASVNSAKRLMVHAMLELNFDVGHQGTVMLRYSDDGGYTWSKEKTRSLGSIGKYATRVRFSALGASRDRVYEYSISDPYRRTLINAYLNEYDL